MSPVAAGVAAEVAAVNGAAGSPASVVRGLDNDGFGCFLLALRLLSGEESFAGIGTKSAL